MTKLLFCANLESVNIWLFFFHLENLKIGYCISALLGAVNHLQNLQ